MAPLRELIEDTTVWAWEAHHDAAFNLLKKLLTNSPVLKYFDVNESVVISTDASKSGLGSVLLQNGQPVAYASRAFDAE